MCELCCITAQGIPMFAHLTGNKHRQRSCCNLSYIRSQSRGELCRRKITRAFYSFNVFYLRQTYLEMRFREYDLDKFRILKRAQEIQDKEGKRIDLIKKIISKTHTHKMLCIDKNQTATNNFLIFKCCRRCQISISTW